MTRDSYTLLRHQCDAKGPKPGDISRNSRIPLCPCKHSSSPASGCLFFRGSLINKFSPALKKYARKLETEDAYYDLQVEFLDLILHLDCNTLRKTGDGAMVQYLSQSIYHAYIKLLRQLIDNKMPNISTDDLTDSMLYQSCCIDSLKDFTLDIPSTLLSPLEADAFFQISILGYSAAELARKEGVSRQSINQAKQKAILKLRRYLQESGQA